MICFLKASEFLGHYYSLRFHGVSNPPIQSLGFDRGRFENRSMNIARKEDLFAPGVLPFISKS